MALPCALLKPFLLALALAYLGLSTCHLLKGSVSCLDCRSHRDLSGTTVAVECKHDKTQITTLTDDKGYFESKITSSSPHCFARLLGGPEQICSYRKFMISRVVKGKGSDHNYSLSTPLTFLTSCPLQVKRTEVEELKKEVEFGSSKTVDLPLPREWGLAPSSYYLPFIPIIGIP